VNDLTSILAIETGSFSDPWSAAVWRDELTRSGSVVIVAERHGELDGYVAARRMVEEGEVLRIAVLPQHRRRGLGARLFHRAAEKLFAAGARRLSLEVRADNTSAVAFYASIGLREVGRRSRYYPDGEDALVLRSDLPLGSRVTEPAAPGGDSPVLS